MKTHDLIIRFNIKIVSFRENSRSCSVSHDHDHELNCGEWCKTSNSCGLIIIDNEGKYYILDLAPLYVIFGWISGPVTLIVELLRYILKSESYTII